MQKLFEDLEHYNSTAPVAHAILYHRVHSCSIFLSIQRAPLTPQALCSDGNHDTLTGMIWAALFSKKGLTFDPIRAWKVNHVVILAISLFGIRFCLECTSKMWTLKTDAQAYCWEISCTPHLCLTRRSPPPNDAQNLLFILLSYRLGLLTQLSICMFPPSPPTEI